MRSSHHVSPPSRHCSVAIFLSTCCVACSFDKNLSFFRMYKYLCPLFTTQCREISITSFLRRFLASQYSRIIGRANFPGAAQGQACKLFDRISNREIYFLANYSTFFGWPSRNFPFLWFSWVFASIRKKYEKIVPYRTSHNLKNHYFHLKSRYLAYIPVFILNKLLRKKDSYIYSDRLFARNKISLRF